MIYVVFGALAAILGYLLIVYVRGREDGKSVEQGDVAKQELHDVDIATKIARDVAAMPDAVVHERLRSRWTRK